MKYFLQYLGLISTAILFLSLFPFLIKKIEIGKEKRIFVYFIAFSVLSEIVVQTTYWHKINNIGLAHVYFSVEFFFFFFILYQWETRYKRYWLISGLLIGVFVLIDNFIITPFSKFATYSASLQNFYLFLFSARLLVEITTKNFVPFYRDDRFYIAAGIFIYSSITALMYLLYNFFTVILPFNVGYVSVICLNSLFIESMISYYWRKKILAEALG
ncbi:MAG: hypothetical protein WCS69_07540 [Ignavibacteriaceae bacterium]|jgi:hypothetical protein